MGIIKKHLKNQCFWWSTGNKPLDIEGYEQHSPAQEVICRWTDKTTEVLMPDATRETSSAKVWLLEAPKVGDFLMLIPDPANPGSVNDDPKQVPEAQIVLSVKITYDIKGNTAEIIAMVK